MNQVLMEQIVSHIFVNLGVMPSSSFDELKSFSLITKEFLLKQKILFKNDDGNIVKNPVYGCQASIQQKDFIILVADCSQDKETPEFCVVSQLTGYPTYGLYMVCNPNLDSEALLAVSVDDGNWMPCSTFL